MHPRTAARRKALDVLFSADLLGRSIAEVLNETPRINKIARSIAEGCAANAQQIDAIISSKAERWSLDRMPIVDRNILRIAIYELLHESDVPEGAAVNDAVELAKLLSTEDSGRFINGLLNRVARERS